MRDGPFFNLLFSCIGLLRANMSCQLDNDPAATMYSDLEHLTIEFSAQQHGFTRPVKGRFSIYKSERMWGVRSQAKELSPDVVSGSCTTSSRNSLLMSLR
ncbi:hypothetical protein BDZ97DRAFT_983268 [Flammula alnicola]|nr:hypothetical protein BDZ97DRAFT_983268 [Flammula alnicola]